MSFHIYSISTFRALMESKRFAKELQYLILTCYIKLFIKRACESSFVFNPSPTVVQ